MVRLVYMEVVGVDPFFDLDIDDWHLVVLFSTVNFQLVFLLERVGDPHAFWIGTHHDVLYLHEVVWDFFEQTEGVAAEEVWEIVEKDQ